MLFSGLTEALPVPLQHAARVVDYANITNGYQ